MCINNICRTIILTDVLQYCGDTTKNRIAIFDVQPKTKDKLNLLLPSAAGK